MRRRTGLGMGSKVTMKIKRTMIRMGKERGTRRRRVLRMAMCLGTVSGIGMELESLCYPVSWMVKPMKRVERVK